MLPKLVITDIDGVWTDGGMYYDQTGNEWKRFNTADSAGVVLLRMLDIPTAIITGENTEIVARRAAKLKIEDLHQGIKQKLPVGEALCAKYKVELNEVAYIGDDVGDLPLLKAVGRSACPAQAPNYIQREVDWVLSKNGGEGVFREFIERMLHEAGQLEEALAKWVAKVS